MKRMNWIKALGKSLLALSWAGMVQAGIPLWQFTPDAAFPPHITVFMSETATVKYTVSNNTRRMRNLVIKAQEGITQTLPCVVGPRGSANSSCILTLQINASELPGNLVQGGPALCQANLDNTPNPNQCYQPGPNDTLVIRRTTVPNSVLNANPSTLGLAINNIALNPALTGNPREIIISNTGMVEATDLNITYPPSLPAGTSASSTCGSTLAVGAQCTITITPGSTPTSNCDTGIAPTTSNIIISASNALTSATSNVLILSYGCQYQGGFLFAVDDTTPPSGSIGGKITSLIDQAPPYIDSSTPPGPGLPWDADPLCPACSQQTFAQDFYYGQDLSSVPGSTNPGGIGVNGPGNTWLISSVLNGNNGNNNTPLGNYAAGRCIAYSGSGYTDWYLPALCEMDADAVNCLTPVQNIGENLSFLIGNPGNPMPSTSCSPPAGADCLAGFYWSSTELATPTAYFQLFSFIGNMQNAGVKTFALGTRCVRMLTP